MKLKRTLALMSTFGLILGLTSFKIISNNPNRISSKASKTHIIQQEKRYYYNQYLNIESFNQNFDRERSYMASTTEDIANYYATIDPDTVQDGMVTFYYKTGEIYQIDSYDNHIIVSRKKFFKNGKKMMVERSVAKISEGVYSGNLPSSTIGRSTSIRGRAVSYSSDCYSEVISFWDANGKKLIRNGNGKYIEYYPSGKLMLEGEYSNGIPTGNWKGYYENGKQMYSAYNTSSRNWIVENIFNEKGDTIVSNGKGKCDIYYPNQKLQFSGNYFDGKLDGVVTSYYSTGEPKVISFYENGRISGKYESYYQNGKPCDSGMMKFHKKSGEWKRFDTNGSLLYSVNYK